MVLLVVAAPERLSPQVRTAVASGPNWISVLTYWEVLIKTMKGKLEVGEPNSWWVESLDQLSATVLPLEAQHVRQIASLPLLHHDPFDRALIAQAIVEELTLVTTDRIIPEYASENLSVIR